MEQNSFFWINTQGTCIVAGNETIGPNPIEEKGWIYPT